MDINGKLSVNGNGILNLDTQLTDDQLAKMYEYKYMFEFITLIKDPRAKDVFSDCGFGGMNLYINIYNTVSKVNIVNGFELFTENNYGLRLRYGKVSWLDLWKAIDEIVKLNGNIEEFVISNFIIKESAKNKTYVKLILETKHKELHNNENSED